MTLGTVTPSAIPRLVLVFLLVLCLTTQRSGYVSATTTHTLVCDETSPGGSCTGAGTAEDPVICTCSGVITAALGDTGTVADNDILECPEGLFSEVRRFSFFLNKLIYE